MNNKAAKCQPQESYYELALKLPVLHEQNNQAKLRNHHQKFRYFGDVLSDRPSARRRFGSCQSEFKSLVASLDFSSFHRKVPLHKYHFTVLTLAIRSSESRSNRITIARNRIRNIRCLLRIVL